MKQLDFEMFNCALHNRENGKRAHLQLAGRAKVPGGWLVLPENRQGPMMFIPDPEHAWELAENPGDGQEGE